MAGEPIIEFTGNCTEDPQLTYLDSGLAVANFGVANTPRRKNHHTGEWEDGTTIFLNCAVWRTYAENVAATFRKGTAVWVRGRLVDDSYDGENGPVKRWKVDVDETGPLLRHATAQIIKGGNKQSSHVGRAQPVQRHAPASHGNVFEPPF
jgi:single-strand DNA-binding protein